MQDHYPTPDYVIDELLHLNLIKDHSYILEPCAGSGSIIRRVGQWYPHSIFDACEILGNMRSELSLIKGIHMLFMDNFMEMPHLRDYDYVIANPPFSQREKFIRKCYKLLKNNGKMAFLLRLSLLGGLASCNMYREMPPTLIYVLGKRPGFIGKVCDQGGYCWVIWDKPFATDDTIIKWSDFGGK